MRRPPSKGIGLRVPTTMLDPKKAQEIAESILQVGLQSPILLRQDGERFVLVEGLHRFYAPCARPNVSLCTYGPLPLPGRVMTPRDTHPSFDHLVGNSEQPWGKC